MHQVYKDNFRSIKEQDKTTCQVGTILQMSLQFSTDPSHKHDYLHQSSFESHTHSHDLRHENKT